MANVVATQILEEGPRNAVVKITGVLDTSNYSIADIITVASLNCGGTRGTPTALRIDHIDFSIADQLEVILWWKATSDLAILPIAGRGRMSFWNFGGLQNNAGAGKTGDIRMSTTGWASGTQVFSIVLELVKQGDDTV
jgi:hypothetical protein